MANSTVRWFRSDFPGAPQFGTDSSGLFNAALKAFLTTGFNEQSVASVVVDAQGVATVTTDAAHGFVDHSWVRISGANESALNDDWQIFDASGSTFKFQTGETSLTATGTILSRFAPIPHWTVLAENATQIAFVSTHPDSFGNAFVVFNDTPFQYVASTVARNRWGALVGGVLNFTDFTDTPWSGELDLIYQTHTLNQNKTYWFFGDERGFFFEIDSYHTSHSVSYSNVMSQMYAFTDLIPVNPLETDLTFIHAGAGTGIRTVIDHVRAYTQSGGFGLLNDSRNKRISKSYTKVANGQEVVIDGYLWTRSGVAGFDFPSNRQALETSLLTVRSDNLMAGAFPGIRQILHDRPIGEREFIKGQDGRIYTTIQGTRGRDTHWGDTNFIPTTTAQSMFLVDVTGPWR